MGWPAYAIVAYLMLGVQVGIGQNAGFHAAVPNLALIAVIFTALYARNRDSALLGCFFIGLTQDFLTGGQPGVYAFSYGLVALFVRGSSQFISRTHPVTHLSLALAGGIITTVVLVLQSWLHPAGVVIAAGNTVLPAVRIPIRVELIRIVYTAALAPVFLFVLQRIRGMFVMQPAHRKVRHW